MSTKHLAKGDPLPNLPKDKITLFSMLFCPYAQRVRLILALKQIEHNVINVNLCNKPEWLVNFNAKGQVPVLYINGKCITGSLEICQYLNEKYTEPALYNNDTKQGDIDIINGIDPLISLYYRAVWKKDQMTLFEYIDAMRPHLEKLEEILRTIGTYFGGDNPKFVDYMIWPWAERAEVIALTFNEKLSLDQYPLLKQWCFKMKDHKAIKETLISSDRHFKATQFHLGAEPLYDQI